MKKFIAFILLCSAIMFFGISFASANGQETCPNSGGWEKVDGLSGLTYTFTAPDGKLISEWCYKASTTVIYGVVEPPQNSFTVESTVLNPNGNAYQELSHASFLLVDKVTETPTETATETPTETPTETVTETPTETVTGTPQIKKTPTYATFEPPSGTPEVLLPVTGGSRILSSVNSVVWNMQFIFFGLGLVCLGLVFFIRYRK